MSEVVKKERDYEGVLLKQSHTMLGLGRGWLGLVRVTVGLPGASYASLAFSSDAGRANEKEPCRLMQASDTKYRGHGCTSGNVYYGSG